jgi:hypothetical protein
MVALTFVAGAALVALPGQPPSPAAGSISGKITYTGTPPKMKPIDMSKEPVCAKEHAAKPVLTENVVTGKDNSIEYAVIYISGGDQGSTAPTKALKFDQKGCQYIPHVLAMQVSQKFQIFNDDPTSHNIHPLAKVNPEWNKSQPPGTPPLDAQYPKSEFIPVKCNVHPWMHGYFIVLNTSHYSVSDDEGNFSIKDLPPGKYTVTAWHEQFGTQSQDVTVGAGDTKGTNFVFKAVPY